jgi:hypothetical protein
VAVRDRAVVLASSYPYGQRIHLEVAPSAEILGRQGGDRELWVAETQITWTYGLIANQLGFRADSSWLQDVFLPSTHCAARVARFSLTQRCDVP